MTNTSRRLIFFAFAFVGSLGLLVVLLLVVARPPRPISVSEPSPSPQAATPVPRTVAIINGEPLSLEAWKQAVALDHVMSTLVGQTPPSPEETLDQLVNERLVFRAAVAAGIPEADRAQVEAWLANFLDSWRLEEAALDQALAQAGLTRADLMEKIVPRLLRVERALNELPPNGDVEAWIANLRSEAQVEVLENLSVSLSSPQPMLQPTSLVVSTPASLGVAELAPDLSLPTTTGTLVSLTDPRGRPVVLYFWATWCAPCRAGLSLLEAAYQGDSVVLSINVRESPDTVIAFATGLDLEFPLLLDQEGQVSDAYGVHGLPTSLFVDRDGFIAARHVGPLDQATLDGYLALFSVTSPASSPIP